MTGDGATTVIEPGSASAREELRGWWQPGHAWWRKHAWWPKIARLGCRPARRLRLCESLSLGERRFVAVVEFDRECFLVGGTSGSLNLLARLGNRDEIRGAKANEVREGTGEGKS